jgi:hypothetical protein
LQPPLQRLYISTPFQPYFCSFLPIISSFLLIRTAFAPHFTPFEQFVFQCFFPPNRPNARHIKHLQRFFFRPHIEHYVLLPVHFMLLRNLYEKTSNFLDYPQWSDLLPDDKKTYYNRIIQFTSHSTLSNEAVPEPTEPEKNTLKLLLKYLVDNNYYTEE